MLFSRCIGILLFSLLSACTTSSLEVQLPSFHVMRPKAGNQDFAVQIGGGLVQAPEIQGLAPAVHDADGAEINSVPDYLSSNPIFLKYGDYGTKGLLDVGLNFKKHFELGWSTTRGVYAFLDLVEWGPFALSISPAYYNASQLSRDRSSSLEDGPKKYGASVIDRSLTALASFLIGTQDMGGLVLYGGYGHHRIGLQIKDYRSEESAAVDADGKTILAGFGLDTSFARIFVEQAWTELPQRTGAKPKARSFACGGTLTIGG